MCRSSAASLLLSTRRLPHAISSSVLRMYKQDRSVPVPPSAVPLGDGAAMQRGTEPDVPSERLISMLVRLVVVTLVLAGCGGVTGDDGIETHALSDPATGPDCSTAVRLPHQDPVAEVRLVRFDAGDGGFGATVAVQPLRGDLELRDVPRPIRGRASDAPYGPGVAPAPPVVGVANAEMLTATADTPLELVVVGGYPVESSSSLWINASIPSVGTFSCLTRPVQ